MSTETNTTKNYMQNNELTQLKDRLKAARKKQGITQKKLAELAGLAQTTIGNLEAGITSSSSHMNAIAKALDVHPEWLISHRFTIDLPYIDGSYYADLTKLPLIDFNQIDDYLAGKIEKENLNYQLCLIPMNTRNSENVFMLKVPDDALAKKVAEGEILVVDSTEQHLLGDVVLIKTQDNSNKIRILAADGDDVFFKAASSDYKNYSKASVLATAIGKFQMFK
jgi:transcriptional regulator with XRE-family HTH domain